MEMKTVCVSERCPRRWVCLKAEPVNGPAVAADYRKSESCWELNDFSKFERGSRSMEDLVRLEMGVLAAHIDLLNSIEVSREFLAEEEEHGRT